MERHKPTLMTWIDKHDGEFGRGLIDGFRTRGYFSVGGHLARLKGKEMLVWL